MAEKKKKWAARLAEDFKQEKEAWKTAPGKHKKYLLQQKERFFPRAQPKKNKKVGTENGHDITHARGSGAARPQKFRKNG